MLPYWYAPNEGHIYHGRRVLARDTQSQSFHHVSELRYSSRHHVTCSRHLQQSLVTGSLLQNAAIEGITVTFAHTSHTMEYRDVSRATVEYLPPRILSTRLLRQRPYALRHAA